MPPTPIADCKSWPKAGDTVQLTETLKVSGIFDGGLKRYVGAGALGSDGQTEDMPALIEVAPSGADGQHCLYQASDIHRP